MLVDRSNNDRELLGPIRAHRADATCLEAYDLAHARADQISNHNETGRIQQARERADFREILHRSITTRGQTNDATLHRFEHRLSTGIPSNTPIDKLRAGRDVAFACGQDVDRRHLEQLDGALNQGYRDHIRGVGKRPALKLWHADQCVRALAGTRIDTEAIADLGALA